MLKTFKLHSWVDAMILLEGTNYNTRTHANSSKKRRTGRRKGRHDDDDDNDDDDDDDDDGNDNHIVDNVVLRFV